MIRQIAYHILWLIPSLLLIELLSLKKIFLMTSDLGRHLSDGRLVWGNFDLLRSNFYSYTFPDFSFVNHSWGGGVLLYSVFSLFDFKGLSHLHALIMTLTALPLLFIAQKTRGFRVTFFLSLLALPLITARTEIRPETFSYLFTTTFYLLLWLWRQGSIPRKSLFILPFLMIFWVNIHIYFFLGLVLLALYLLDEWLRVKSWTQDLKTLVGATLLSSLAIFCNPSGWRLLIFSASLFRNDKQLGEYQSVSFYWNQAMPISGFAAFHGVALLLIIGSIFYVLKKKSPLSPLGFFALICLLMSTVSVGNFSLLGFFAIPALAQAAPENTAPSLRKIWLWLLSTSTIVSFAHWFQFVPFIGEQFGSGLFNKVENSAKFYQEQAIKGPIFNNYEIGSYLIFNLFPAEKVFIDKRQEAYPRDFFNNQYRELQDNPGAWQNALDRFGFNSIYFYRLDNSPAAQGFLLRRIEDPSWVPVYVDQLAIIFVRNTEGNQAVIEKFKLPKEMFKLGS